MHFRWDSLYTKTLPIDKPATQLEQIRRDLQSGLDQLSQHTNRIIFSMPNLKFPHSVGSEMYKRFAKGMDLNGVNMELEVENLLI